MRRGLSHEALHFLQPSAKALEQPAHPVILDIRALDLHSATYPSRDAIYLAPRGNPARPTTVDPTPYSQHSRSRHLLQTSSLNSFSPVRPLVALSQSHYEGRASQGARITPSETPSFSRFNWVHQAVDLPQHCTYLTYRRWLNRDRGEVQDSRRTCSDP